MPQSWKVRSGRLMSWEERNAPVGLQDNVTKAWASSWDQSSITEGHPVLICTMPELSVWDGEQEKVIARCLCAPASLLSLFLRCLCAARGPGNCSPGTLADIVPSSAHFHWLHLRVTPPFPENYSRYILGCVVGDDDPLPLKYGTMCFRSYSGSYAWLLSVGG